MKIAKKHSHLNGEEWLLVHEKEVYQEILEVVQAVDAEKCRTKVSKERRKEGEFHKILRHGRSNPPVPLVIIGVEPN